MNISKIVLGTVQFGMDYGINNPQGKPSEKACFEILNFAKEKGIQELDTADAYGSAQTVLKKYFGSHSSSSFKVMSKFIADERDFSSHFQESLHSLGLVSLEGYYFHRFEDFKSFKSFDEVRKFKQIGSLRKLAVSLYSEDELKVVVNHPEVDVIQLPFNLLDRAPSKIKLLEVAKANKKDVYVRSVFLQGLFHMDLNKYPDKIRGLQESVKELRSIAEKFDLTMTELCLNYALHQDFIDKLVIGVDNIEHLTSNLNAIRKTFDSDCKKAVEGVLVDTSLLNPARWNS